MDPTRHTPDRGGDARLNRLIPDLMTPAAAERLRQIGIDVKWTTPDEMRDWVDSQLKYWGKIAKDIEPQ
jgi:tripartite-type tricarboxylate transporter receptor subunit TctC